MLIQSQSPTLKGVVPSKHKASCDKSWQEKPFVSLLLPFPLLERILNPVVTVRLKEGSPPPLLAVGRKNTRRAVSLAAESFPRNHHSTSPGEAESYRCLGKVENPHQRSHIPQQHSLNGTAGSGPGRHPPYQSTPALVYYLPQAASSISEIHVLSHHSLSDHTGPPRRVPARARGGVARLAAGGHVALRRRRRGALSRSPSGSRVRWRSPGLQPEAAAARSASEATEGAERREGRRRGRAPAALPSALPPRLLHPPSAASPVPPSSPRRPAWKAAGAALRGSAWIKCSTVRWQLSSEELLLLLCSCHNIRVL